MITYSTLEDFARRLEIRSGAGDQGVLEFNDSALELFALQFAGVAPYRRLCQARGLTPDRIRDWRAIPAMPASAFKEFEVSSLPQTERSHVFLSSGTMSQSRSRHFHNRRSLAIYEAALWIWFQQHLLPEGGEGASAFGLANVSPPCELVVLTPPAQAAPNSSLVHMFETIGRRFGTERTHFLGEVGADGGWVLDSARVAALLRECVARQAPVLSMGTAFSYVHLCDGLEQMGERFQLPIGSRALETGGYKGRSRALTRAELRQLMTERLALAPGNIVSEYGMSELSSQAYDRRVGSNPTEPEFYHFPPWVRVQIISPETGREVADGATGLIRILDLANVFSVASIQTEDLGTRRGAGFSLIGRALRAEPRGCSLMAEPA